MYYMQDDTVTEVYRYQPLAEYHGKVDKDTRKQCVNDGYNSLYELLYL